MFEKITKDRLTEPKIKQNVSITVVGAVNRTGYCFISLHFGLTEIQLQYKKKVLATNSKINARIIFESS